MMHQQMTYPEIASFFKNFETYLEDERLSLRELDCYYCSLDNDPLLEVMIERYPPYSQKVKNIIEKSLDDYHYRDNIYYQRVEKRKAIRANKRVDQGFVYVMRTYVEHEDVSEDLSNMLKFVDENMGNMFRTVERLDVARLEKLNSQLQSEIVAIGNFIKNDINQINIFDSEELFEELIGAGSIYHENEELMTNPYWQKLSSAIMRYSNMSINETQLKKELNSIMVDITAFENPYALLTSEESVAVRLLSPFLVRDKNDNILPTKAFYDLYRFSAGLDLPEAQYRRQHGEYWNDLETHRVLRNQTAFGG